MCAFQIHPPWTEMCQTVSLWPWSDSKVMGQMPWLGERVTPHSSEAQVPLDVQGLWASPWQTSVGEVSAIAQVLE